MIKLNGRDYPWKEGTVKQLLEIKRFIYPRIIVKVNDEVISPEDYENTQINDGDDVKVIHLLAGG